MIFLGKEFPESGLVRKTFIIRQMDFPPEVSLTRRSLVRWFALSFGLISPKETRSKILDVLDALFYFQIAKKQLPKVKDVMEYLNSNKKGVGEKALRYHLKRLLDVGLLEWRGAHLGFPISAQDEWDDFPASLALMQSGLNNYFSTILKCALQIKSKYKS